jgi:hypothetical protein
MPVQLLKLKAKVGGSTYQVLLKLVDSEQQTYLYVGLLDMQINELEEVCPLN